MKFANLNILAVAILIFCAAGSGAASAATDFFVDQILGKDGNSGGFDQPFKTIQKCAELSGRNCLLRGGIYSEFNIRPENNVNISAYDGEDVLLDGTELIPSASWVVHDKAKGVYKAQVEGMAERPLDSNQIFAMASRSKEAREIFQRKEMMTEARWPNGDSLFSPVWAVAGPGTTQEVLRDTAGNRVPAGDWSGARIVWFSGDGPWKFLTGKLTSASFDSGGLVNFKLQGNVVLNGTGRYRPIEPMAGGRYYISGSMAALDAPREWYFNRPSKTLYFIPPDGLDPSTGEVGVYYKKRDVAIIIDKVSGVSISDINLFSTTIQVAPAEDWPSMSRTTGNSIDSIRAAYVSHFSEIDAKGAGVTDVTFNTFNTGIVVNGSDNTIKNSEIFYSAGSGISTNGDRNKIFNNYIHHVNYSGNYGAGVVSRGRNVVDSNTIHTTGKHAVYLTSAYQIAPWNVGNNSTEVKNNNIFNTQLLLVDGGAIYVAGSVLEGASIHHNYIQAPFRIPYASPYLHSPSVYIDYGSTGHRVYENYFWSVSDSAVYINGDDKPSSNRQNNNHVFSNTVLSKSAGDLYFYINGLTNCSGTNVANNKVPVKVGANPTKITSSSLCSQIYQNDESQKGATAGSQMPGCSLNGNSFCSENRQRPLLGGASIIRHPSDVVSSEGGDFKLDAVAIGENVNYQWLKDGRAIYGATGNNLVIRNLSLKDGGSYSVVVSNAFGQEASLPAKVSVDASKSNRQNRPAPPTSDWDFLFRDPVSITSLKFSNYKAMPGLSPIDVQSPQDFSGPANSWRIVRQPGGNFVKVYISGTSNVLQVSEKNRISPQFRQGNNSPGFGYLVEYGQESVTNDLQIFTIEKSGSMYLLKSKIWGNPVCTHWSGPLIQCSSYYRGAVTHELGISSLMR